MVKILTKHWSIKLICLLVATLLWVYVATTQSSIAKFPGAIRIKAFNSQQDLIANYDTDSVEIKVMTAASNWQKLSSDSFSAYVDLSGYGVGTYDVPVNVVSSVPGVQIVEKNPSKILVTLETVVSKKVPIVKKIEGNAKAGMTAGTVKFTPDAVDIAGAKSVIESINEVEGLIVLDGEDEKFNRKVPLVISDQRYANKKISITPQQVDADISIVKGSDIKTVGIKANLIGTPRANYYISNIIITPNIIDVTGPIPTLNELKYIETAPVDIEGSTNTISQDVILNFPESVSTIGAVLGKVHLEVQISQNDLVKEFSTNNFKIINSRNSVIKIDPKEVVLKCSGTGENISNLKADDIIVNLNLQNRMPDQAGFVYFNITPDILFVPTGVAVREIVTKTVAVQIQ